MKTKLFDLKYVHDCWDDEIDCRGYFDEQSKKLVEAQFVGDSIGEIMSLVERLADTIDSTNPNDIKSQISSIDVESNEDVDKNILPFKSEGFGKIHYVYFDPNLVTKIAYINGATIEYYDDEDKFWHKASQVLWDDDILRWDDGTLYRIKGEDKKPKLQWYSLTIGDVITNGAGILEMVTCISTNGVNSHIYAMGRWISDKELETFYKVED